MRSKCELQSRPDLLPKTPPSKRLGVFLKKLQLYDKPSTVAAYQSVIEGFKQIVKKPIGKLSPDDILRYFDHL